MTSRIFIFALLCATVLSSCSGSKSSVSNTDSENGAGELDPKMQVSLERRFIDAIREKHLGNYEEALKLFEEVTRRDPANDAAHYELSQLYYGSGLMELSLSHAKKAVELVPENKWYQLLLADIYSSIYKFEEAAAVYEQIVDKFPEEYELYLDWAYMNLKAENYEKAIQAYDELEKIVGIDESISFQKQSIFLRMNDLNSAVAEIEKLIAEFPEKTEYYTVLADMYEVNGDQESAAKVYQRMIDANPDNPAAQMALAKIKYNEGDIPGYFELMSEAFRSPNLDVDSKIMVLYTYIEHYESRQEEWEDAEALAEILVEAHPEEAKSYAIQGDLKYLADKLEEAQVSYRKSLEFEDGVYNVWQQILLIDADLLDYDAMLEDAERAIERFPNQSLPNFFLGVAQSHFNQNEKAIRSYGRALMMSSTNLNLKSQIYSNLGDLYHSIGEFKASDSCYSASLDIDPNNAFVLNNYAYFLSLRNDNLDEAEKMSKRSNELMPGNASFEDTYAWILYQKGDYKKAKEWIEKALSNEPTANSVLLEHYGDILYKLGEIDQAVEQWNKALNAGGDADLIGRKIADRKLYD